MAGARQDELCHAGGARGDEVRNIADAHGAEADDAVLLAHASARGEAPGAHRLDEDSTVGAIERPSAQPEVGEKLETAALAAENPSHGAGAAGAQDEGR